LANLNKSLVDEQNQPTSFPTTLSSKKNPKTPIKPKTQWVGLFKIGFLNPENGPVKQRSSECEPEH